MPTTGGWKEVVTAPTDTVLTLDDAKRQLRVTWNDDDTAITDYLHACREYAERHIPGGLALLQTTFDHKRSTFPAGRDRLYLSPPPLSSVTSATYYDTAGDSQTLTENTDFYTHAPDTGQGWLVPVPGTNWPDTQLERSDAVTIRFVAGYTQSTVPHLIRQAMRLALGGFWEFRESMIAGTIIAELPLGVQHLLDKESHGFHG